MSINEILTAYNNAKKAESEAKKEKETLQKLIIEYAKGKESFLTDTYTVIIDSRTRSGLDTKKLYADFPDIKKEYGTETEYKVITAKEIKSTKSETA